jgi:hypothetical protein
MISGLACAVVVVGFGLVQDKPPELPPGHPPTGLPPGHPAVEPGQAAPSGPRPSASPDDVGSPRAVMEAYYRSMSGTEEEPRDWDRFRSLFLPQGHLMTVGGGGPLLLTPEKFVALNQQYFEGSGYSERSIHERVDEFGQLAHVLSTYESRRRGDDAPYSRGINSFQLVEIGDRWWIVSVMWDRERGDVRLPPEYLPAADD